MAMLIHPILNFDQLSVEQAYGILDNEIVPLCKRKGIKLSIYCANVALGSVKKYNKAKRINRLCNVEKVQKVFRFLGEGIVNEVNQSINLYRIRNIIKRDKGETITNAECIAAMLVKGYIADFKLDHGKLGIDCEFYVKLDRQ